MHLSKLIAFPLVAAAVVIPAAASSDSADLSHFENKIRPVLVERCYECHSTSRKVKGGLVLDTKDGLLKGGDTGPAIDLTSPDKSLLVKALRHQDDLQMPPKSDRLPESVANDFALWIKSGAPDPRTSESKPAQGIDWHKARQHWAFQAVKRPPLPSEASSAHPIDRFIRARLAQEGLQPSAQARARTRIRRLSFTLTGLPPAFEDVEAFEKDASAEHYRRLVDRYLSSREFAEKWGRHWLDVARYAEDQAHTFGVKPNSEAWKYRDWVINAFEQDLPYDTFVRHQIAADFLPEPDRKANLAALGLFGLGAQYYKNTDAARAIADELDDRVDTLSRGFLGLTLSCARCHDHKYDPVPTQDYYSIAGVFHSSRLVNAPEATQQEIDRYNEAKKQLDAAELELNRFVREQRHAALLEHCDQTAGSFAALDAVLSEKRRAPSLTVPKDLDPLFKLLERFRNDKKYKNIAAAWLSLEAAGSEEEKSLCTDILRDAFADTVQKEQAAFISKKPDKNLQEIVDSLFGEKGAAPLGDGWKSTIAPEARQQLASLESTAAERKKILGPELPVVHAIAENKPADLKVYIRGNPANQGAISPRRFLRVLAGDDPTPFAQGSGRSELADAIADKANPLTPRVMVNRLWGWTFGRGIVNTPSNFGVLGDKPTHPELLDWLAAEFMDNNWSVKSVLRLLVTSETFQQSSEPSPVSREKDGNNALLSRFQSRRMDIESWRDSVLFAAGSLEPAKGGPTFPLSDSKAAKRTVYAKVSRHELDSLLRLFDFPDPNITSEKRVETTIPQQQLFMINSPFVLTQAERLAKRVKAAANDDAERVRIAHRFTLSREPAPEEADLLGQFLRQQDRDSEKNTAKQERIERLCQALLISNEFLFID
jgi:hypothetical protein